MFSHRHPWISKLPRNSRGSRKRSSRALEASTLKERPIPQLGGNRSQHNHMDDNGAVLVAAMRVIHVAQLIMRVMKKIKLVMMWWWIVVVVVVCIAAAIGVVAVAGLCLLRNLLPFFLPACRGCHW